MLNETSESKKLPKKEDLRYHQQKKSRKGNMQSDSETTMNTDYFTTNETDVSHTENYRVVLSKCDSSQSNYETASNTLNVTDISGKHHFSSKPTSPAKRNETIVISSDDEDEHSIEQELNEIIELLDEDILKDKLEEEEKDTLQSSAEESKLDDSFYLNYTKEDANSSNNFESLYYGTKTAEKSLNKVQLLESDSDSESPKSSAKESDGVEDSFIDEESVGSIENDGNVENKMIQDSEQCDENYQYIGGSEEQQDEEESEEHKDVESNEEKSEKSEVMSEQEQPDAAQAKQNLFHNYLKDDSLLNDSLLNETFDDKKSFRSHNYSNNFNDTLQEMEFFLNSDASCEIDQSKQNDSSKLTSSLSENNTSGTSSNIPLKPISIEQKYVVTKETHDFKFKTPKVTPKTLPKIKPTNNFKNIISPIGFYIKNSPSVPLKRNIPVKKFTLPPSAGSSSQTSKKENIACEMPEVVYKPSKKTVVANKFGYNNLPGKIQKLVPQSPSIIKHKGRTNIPKPTTVQKKLDHLQNDMTMNVVDESFLNNTQDCSVVSIKKAYIS